MQTPFNKLEIGDNFASCILRLSPRYFIFEIWHWIFAVPSTWWIFMESLEMKNWHSPLNHDWNKRLTIWVKWLVSDPFFEHYKTFCFQPFPNFTFICIIWLFNLNLFYNPILWRLSHSVNSSFQKFLSRSFLISWSDVSYPYDQWIIVNILLSVLPPISEPCSCNCFCQ